MRIQKAWSKMSPIQKADFALSELSSNGGALPPEQAQRFIRVMVEKANLLPLCTVLTMDNPSRKIPGMRFSEMILKPATSGTRQESGDRSKPVTNEVELTPKHFRGTIKIDDETLEDNIEKEGFINSVVASAADRIAIDVDQIILNGDTDLGGGVTLAQLDGFRKQVTSQIYDADNEYLSPTLLSNAYKLMDKTYKKPRANMRFITSCNAREDYRRVYASRQTALGDDSAQSAGNLMPNGIKLLDIDAMPEDLGVDSRNTELLLTHPKSNLFVGFQRRITFERERVAREGATYIVINMRMDAKVFLQQAVVKMTNLRNA